jgi:cyclophilin family peptidyl-prolyl cis-trans isomerase
MHTRVAQLAVLLLSILSAGVSQSFAADPGIYAVFVTSLGGFTCRLDYARAPRTTANFVGLAEGSNAWINFKTGEDLHKNFYNGTIFHRVVSNFVIQGGGQQMDSGFGGPGYSFRDEFHPELKHDTSGVLSMANSGPNSQGSQFFITVVTNYASGDGKYSVFGRVIDGMEVVRTINHVPTSNERPVVDVVLSNVTIVRVGAEAQAFDWKAHGLPVVAGTVADLRKNVTNLDLPFSRETNCSYNLFYSSNLVSWSSSELSFSTNAEPTNVLDVTALVMNNPAQFFTVAQVSYPAPVYTPMSLEGKSFHLTLTDTGTKLDQWFYGNATGTWRSVTTNGSSANGDIFHYDWTPKAYGGKATVYYYTMSPRSFDFAYDTPTSNRFRQTMYFPSYAQSWGTFTNGTQ